MKANCAGSLNVASSFSEFEATKLTERKINR